MAFIVRKKLEMGKLRFKYIFFFLCHFVKICLNKMLNILVFLFYFLC